MKELIDNPPYLSFRVILLLVLLIAGAVAANLVEWIGKSELSNFFAACTAGGLFVVAAWYSRLLLSWRSMRTGALRLCMNMSGPDVGMGKFEFDVIIRNDLPWGVHMENIIWEHTQHLSIPECRNWDIPRHSMVKRTVSCEAVAAGPGAIIGVGIILTDAFEGIKAEFCLEQNIKVNVLIKDNERVLDAERNRTFGLSAGDWNAGRIRPFQYGDRTNRILWRDVAKGRELRVWDHPEENPKMAVFLIDAGWPMRVPYRNVPNRSRLVDVWGDALGRASEYALVTMVGYDEKGASIILRDWDGKEIAHPLGAWMLDALSFSPPMLEQPGAKELWRQIAYRIWSDFKRYKRVDFSIHHGRDAQIDLQALADWTRREWRIHALKNGNFQAERAISQLSFQEVVFRLLKTRRRWPDFVYLPHSPKSRWMDAFALIPWELHRQIDVFWYSDFSTPLDIAGMEDMLRGVEEGCVRPVAVAMKRPIRRYRDEEDNTDEEAIQKNKRTLSFFTWEEQ